MPYSYVCKDVVLSLIIARDENNGIGKDGKIPWICSQDMQVFRHFTMGNPCIMGRKTCESLGKPLIGRKNIVISKEKFNISPHKSNKFPGKVPTQRMFFIDVIEDNGFCFVRSLYDACRLASSYISIPGQKKEGEIFIIGGAEIYKSFLDSVFLIRRYYISRIHGEYDCDTFLKDISQEDTNFYVECQHSYDSHDFCIIQHDSLKGTTWKNPLPWMDP
jgi:dihydrofolate reductase